MTALPRKHPTGRQKLRKSNRIYPNYSLSDRLKKRELKTNNNFNQAKSMRAQPQRGWTAEQPLQSNQPKPASNWIVILIAIIIAVVALMMLFNWLSNMVHSTYNNADGNNENDCTCYCGDGVTDCTLNHKICPSEDGVPGVCGCPVGC